MPRGCFVATEVLLHAVKCALSKLQGEPRLGVLIVSTRSLAYKNTADKDSRYKNLALSSDQKNII